MIFKYTTDHRIISSLKQTFTVSATVSSLLEARNDLQLRADLLGSLWHPWQPKQAANTQVTLYKVVCCVRGDMKRAICLDSKMLKQA